MVHVDRQPQIAFRQKTIQCFAGYQDASAVILTTDDMIYCSGVGLNYGSSILVSSNYYIHSRDSIKNIPT